MMKRIIALLLALILTVGLLPTVALAADGDTPAAGTSDVKDGYYDSNKEWVEGELTQNLPDGVEKVSKTAARTADNTYEVTLKVVLKQTEQSSGKAATVLVLDTSGSMAYCAECGAEPEEDCEHNYAPVPDTPSKDKTYYYKYTNKNGQVRFGTAHYCKGQHTLQNEHAAGWFKTIWYRSGHNEPGDALSANDLYIRKSRTSRLDAAKVAAENFLKTYSGLTFNTDGTVAANQNSRNLGRYVSVVSFATGAALKQEWVDVSNANNYQTVLNKIKALKADGGTNLDAGLTYAEYLLKQTAVNDAVKNVIALTDGQPTFFIDTNEDAYDDDGLTYSNKEFLTIDRTKYRVHGTGDSCNAKTFTETVASAVAVKNHAKLYTVCFDADEKIGVPDSENQISVSEYLSTKIATQPTKTGEQFAYDASNAEQLYAEFAKITQSIVSGLNTGTVKDILPTGITVSEADKQKFGTGTWELNSDVFTKTEAKVTDKDKDGKTVTTYTYTYTVTIDPLTVAKTEIDGAYYAPLNGDTTLTVKSGDTDVEIPFPIPAGKVTMPSYKVTYKIDDAQYGDVDTVDFGTEVTVRENPTKAGYSFSGWSTTDATVADGKFTMPDKDVTLTGTWTKNSYKVTYKIDDVQYGDVDTVDFGTEVTVRENPTKAGYSFSGWSTTDATVADGKFTMPDKDVTLTGSWTQTQVPVDLSQYIQKSLVVEEGSNLPDNYEETFTFYVFIDDAEGPQSFSVTMAEAGTNYVDKTGTISLTVGLHTFTVREAVPTTKTPGMTYDTAEKTFALMVNADGTYTFGHVNEDEFAAEQNEADRVVIFTNTYTEPKNAQVTKKEVVVTQPKGALKTAVDAFAYNNGLTVLYPTGNGTTSNTLEVPYGTDSVTLLYAITVNRGTESNKMDFDDNGATFVFAVDADVAPGSRDHFDVTFNDGISTAVIYVAKTHTPLNFVGGKCTVENMISEEIKATTTVTKKDPSKLTINFADYVQKELTATGTKTASDVNFTVNVNGKEQVIIITSVGGKEEIGTDAEEFDPKYSTTLTARFDSITGGETKTAPFNGSTVEIDHAGQYYFVLTEEKGTRTGVTYDESVYTVYISVEKKEDKLVVAHVTIYKDYKLFDGNTITFHNTIDTGKDDYYPIIIPTIINKDTGMLNKTDHFAYVIGYPDGTVHPNGQITRAEVATIFFRLLRDEVRDGAFTTSNTYSDVAYGKWYNNPISTMSALGIITGYPDGTFKPNKPITRAEFAAIAARFDETQSGKSATFSDVIGHWAAKEIGIAYYNDWIKGYPDGTFKPDQNITRAEAMTLINRVLERKPESPADLLTNMNKWTDNMDTSKWYYLDVQEATNSHGYTRKTFNYELWRQMLPDPDWSRYER